MNRYISFLILTVIVLLLFSCKTAKLSDAVERHERGEYYEAAQIYRKVYQQTPSKKTHLRGSVAFHMAECYREVNNSSRALSGYTNAIRYNYPDSTTFLHQAQILHKMGRYGEAIKQYTAFLEIDSTNLLAKNGIKGCELAPEWKKNPSRHTVRKMDKMNSRNGEFSPMLLGEEFDQLFISSSRKEATGDEKSPITGVKNNDIFLIKQDEKKQWLKPELIESELNTENDEGLGIDEDSRWRAYDLFLAEKREAGGP